MSAVAITSPGDAREMQAKPLAGLVFAYRFRPDGSSEQLNVEEPPAPDGGWLWLHFNLADMRACQYLATTPSFPSRPAHFSSLPTSISSCRGARPAFTASSPISSAA